MLAVACRPRRARLGPLETVLLEGSWKVLPLLTRICPCSPILTYSGGPSPDPLAFLRLRERQEAGRSSVGVRSTATAHAARAWTLELCAPVGDKSAGTTAEAEAEQGAGRGRTPNTGAVGDAGDATAAHDTVGVGSRGTASKRCAARSATAPGDFGAPSAESLPGDTAGHAAGRLHLGGVRGLDGLCGLLGGELIERLPRGGEENPGVAARSVLQMPSRVPVEASSVELPPDDLPR